MSTITKEFTKEQLVARAETVLSNARTAADFYDSKPYHLMDVHLAEIALASLEAEPVAWLLSGGGAKNIVSFDSGNAYADPLREVTPLYTAPPAPVSVPDGYRLQPISEYDAMCAAMLQGAEHVSNRDELPLGYLQGHKDGLEWAAQLAEANHPQTGDWLYDDPIALAAAIRKGSDMPELKSAFADEDDNFYSWFGRFWLENYQQNNYTTSAKQMLGTMAEFAFRAGRESATQAGNSPVIPDGWAMVPIEPTEDMIVNGFESEPDESFSDEKEWEAYEAMSGCQQAAHRAKLCWEAMISAAPKPTVR